MLLHDLTNVKLMSTSLKFVTGATNIDIVIVELDRLFVLYMFANLAPALDNNCMFADSLSACACAAR